MHATGSSDQPPAAQGRQAGVARATPSADDSEARRLLHELQVHQAELLQQNESLQEARADIAASLRRAFDLYESAPVGLVTVNRSGIVLEVNRGGRELLASAADQSLVGYSLLDLVAAGSRDALRLAIGAPQEPRGGRGVDLVVNVVPPGPVRVLRAEIGPSGTGNDSVLMALTDVTARERAEAELAHVREIQELSNRMARIGYWEFDVQQQRLQWSAVTCEIHAVPADHAPALDTALAYYKAGPSRDRMRAAIDAAIQRGRPFDLELEITTAGGQDRWVRKIGIAEMAEGRCRRLYGTLQDIDTRVQAEGARLAQARAEAANRSKSAFLSRMSHELRTPLNAVLGFSQLLLLDGMVRGSPTTAAQVRHIFNAGEQLLALVNDVLDLARIESGSVRLTAEPIDIGELAAECLAMTAPLAAQHGVGLGISGAGHGQLVAGDRTRLSQVLVNLVSNGIKYNHRGGTVEITLGAEPDRAAIAIRDTGVGLRPDQIAHLYQPFNRLGAEYSGVEGTGLGLVIAHQLVDAMGGTIEVQSTPGQGSVFTVRLPRHSLAERGPSAPAAEPRAGPGLRKRPFLVLYVEDNPVNAELMRQLVSQLDGYRIEIADDGEAGLESARRLQPDLMLLDLNLPVLGGAEVLARLLEDPSLAHIPCVAVSANAMAADIQGALDAGFAEYITKPFSIARVTALLDRYRAAALAPAARIS